MDGRIDRQHYIFHLQTKYILFSKIHVVYEEFETKEQAMKREYAIKQLGRKEKQKLIAGKKVKLSDERKEKED